MKEGGGKRGGRGSPRQTAKTTLVKPGATLTVVL